ncbi:MAG: E2/UBC family protein [Acidimicrobiales bacterium]
MTATLTSDSIEHYLRSVGLVVDVIQDTAGTQFTCVRGITIPAGSLRGRTCDVAIQRINTVPYTVPAAIHTRPALVPMRPGAPLGTQASSLGPEWQYWSRRYDRLPTAQGIWAHILGILSQVTL